MDDLNGIFISLISSINSNPSSNVLVVIELKIFCSTKIESSMIKDIINNNYKYHAYVAKDF